IIIGNFVDDAHSDTVFVNSTGAVGYAMSSYYYIDDVIVSTDSTYADSLFTGVQEYKPNKPNANVYPNPANNLLNVAISLPKGELEYTMCLYNSEGNRVMCETLSSDISTFSINQLSSGMYYYRIIDSSGNLVKADKVTIIK
ncbi:MAG TPA: T9SS type A sorting domain-containing protein, partial [Bacteroidia bacterium]|nr:T9SS type A sorting domain-containing protein [Bacteroidia bacterium]